MKYVVLVLLLFAGCRRTVDLDLDSILEPYEFTTTNVIGEATNKE